jgi:CRISPR/Cas system CSM-associated protein Csm2 small subunit
MCIEHHYIIQDANGEEFAVGSSCIEKIGNVKRMTEAKEAERKRLNKQARERNKIKRQQKQEENLKKWEEKEELERTQNNGLTNKELRDSLEEVLKKQLAEKKGRIFEEISDELCVLRNDFARDLSRQIEPLCSEERL